MTEIWIVVIIVLIAIMIVLDSFSFTHNRDCIGDFNDSSGCNNHNI